MTMRLEDLAGDSCLWCGDEIDLSRPFAISRIYCSAECRVAHKIDVDRQARIEAKEGRRCRHCGAPVPVTRRVDSNCCSDACSAAANRPDRAKRYPLTCQHCNSQFYGHFAAQRFCRCACSAASLSARRKAERGSTNCDHCGTVFDRAYATQRFCSVDCANAYRKERAKEKLGRVCSDCGAGFRVTRIDTAGIRCPTCRYQRVVANLHPRRRITCEAIS